ncbi:serine hydrolase domain-containing protein [Streptomyces sp. NPDC002490]|uniref:serine hydrolase domain-containing protein n=1 Tax=Streptomyces sp. NPDC002490 TaxID=3154416 RepID=UPI003328721E
MNRRNHLASLVGIALSAGPLALPCAAAPARGGPAGGDGPDRTALRAAVAGLPAAHATSAAVRMGGDAVWHGSSGVRDLATGRPALSGGRFRAGSTTKVVTSALVLRLVADGRIDLDAPVQEYLPGLLSPRFRPVAVRHLLTYTSGIRSAGGKPWAQEYAQRLHTVDYREHVAAGIALGPAHEPGYAQRYSNIHYTILGMLVEEVTGRPYAREAERLVLRPLGMRHTSFPGTDPEVPGPHNRGYQVVRGANGAVEHVDVTRWNQYDRFAAGDMISTTADLERLVRGLVRGEVVPRPQVREMFTVPEVGDPAGATMSAGLQRYVSPTTGRVVWVKTGSRYGYHCALAVGEDHRRSLAYAVTSTDAKGPGMDRVGEAVLKATFGL